MEENLSHRIQSKLTRFGKYTVDVVYGRVEGGWALLIYGGILRAFSYLFSGIVQTRFFLYRHRIFHDKPLGCLVVVVGNLTVGGTGKTPVVEKFARSLSHRGRKVAILSRGYGGKSEPKYKRFWRWLTHAPATPPKIVSDGKQVLLNSWDAGDEPYMLARNLPGVVVLVDRNRVKAGEYAIKHFGVDTLLLDDGFQYLPMRGQLNLLMVDKNDPFGNQCLLPRGILREPIKHLRRASYIFLTKSDGKPDPALLDIIEQYKKPEADLIECTHQPQFLQSPFGNEKHELSALKGKRVASFSGIATPESFETFLTDLGAEIIYNQRFLDHHRFTEDELETLFAEAKEAGADWIITTEKDAVRINESAIPHAIPFYYLRLEIELLSGMRDFEEAVSRICFPKHSMKTTRSSFISNADQQEEVEPAL